jgi:hypothetical protein
MEASEELRGLARDGLREMAARESSHVLLALPGGILCEGISRFLSSFYLFYSQWRPGSDGSRKFYEIIKILR